jgi:LPS O-antigen subunit length determinant protein (WzzB/FepE family)
VLKNLETLKLDMARETPLVQMIDEPRMPLKKDRLGKAKGIILGGLIGGLLIVFYLLGGLYFNEIIINKEK